MLITPGELVELRRRERNWTASGPAECSECRLIFERRLRAAAPALLSAAEAIGAIRAIAAEENDLGDFSRRVGVVLAELERGT
jgi:hypothetical protein